MIDLGEMIGEYYSQAISHASLRIILTAGRSGWWAFPFQSPRVLCPKNQTPHKQHGLDLADLSLGMNTDDIKDPPFGEVAFMVERGHRVRREVGRAWPSWEAEPKVSTSHTVRIIAGRGMTPATAARIRAGKGVPHEDERCPLELSHDESVRAVGKG